MSENYSTLLDTLKIKTLSFVRSHYIPRWTVFLHDSIAVFVAFLVACLLRYNFISEDFSTKLAFHHALITTAMYVVFSLIIRPYAGMLRHTTIIDVFYVLLTTTLTFLCMVVLSLAANSFGWPDTVHLPLSILTIHYMMITVFLFGVRIGTKTLYHIISSNTTRKHKVLIYGAGSMGIIVKRVLLSDITGSYDVTGFLDKNRNIQGKKINGIRVYDPSDIDRKFLDKHKVQTMVFAIRDISPAEKSDIIKWGIELGLEVRDTPAVETWLNGELQMRQIEKVKVEDLLGREPIQLNLQRIELGLKGKTVLVTGAAGSIGSEIVRQLTRFKIKTLVLIDIAETPMFHLENELKTLNIQCRIEAILADVTNTDKMSDIFSKFKPDVVFHAAAYKHVPLMEANPHEAFRVNAGGTKLITKLAVNYGVEKFVMVSTDKAVNPTNVMGASKRLCEMIVQLKSQKLGNKTQFIITRFGNVLGSNGSVIPIFEKQIREGGPVTVTHPEIMRYFMTIPEACQLVLEAGFLGKGGEIFVFDMGNPVKIDDLARQMIRLSGFTPGKDIRIEYTGLRPGEKLYEELLADEETTKPTHHPKIKIANVKKLKLEAPGTLLQVENTMERLYSMSKYEVIEILKELVPEYNENQHIPETVKVSAEKEVLDGAGVIAKPYYMLRNFINLLS